MDIRRATLADAEAIRQIYNLEVTGSTATLDLVPRSVEEQAAWMVAHSGVYPVVVADEGGEVIGFASLSPYRPRPGYATAVEDSIYVRPDCTGHRVGSMLLGQLILDCTLEGCHSMVACICGENVPSVALHTSLGFKQVGLLPEAGSKFGQWLRLLIMQRPLR